MSNQRFLVIFTLAILSSLAGLSFFTTTSAQTSKTIIRRLTLVKQPVEISYELNGPTEVYKPLA